MVTLNRLLHCFFVDVRDLPAGSRIVINPFKNVGSDPEDAYFAEGVTRDLNALLAKFTNLFVIAPEANAAFRDDPACESIRDELGADYILAGSVQRSQDKLRVTLPRLRPSPALSIVTV